MSLQPASQRSAVFGGILEALPATASSRSLECSPGVEGILALCFSPSQCAEHAQMVTVSLALWSGWFLLHRSDLCIAHQDLLEMTLWDI